MSRHNLEKTAQHDAGEILADWTDKVWSSV